MMLLLFNYIANGSKISFSARRGGAIKRTHTHDLSYGKIKEFRSKSGRSKKDQFRNGMTTEKERLMLNFGRGDKIAMRNKQQIANFTR
jgi:hypothetical protein